MGNYQSTSLQPVTTLFDCIDSNGYIDTMVLHMYQRHKHTQSHEEFDNIIDECILLAE